MPRKLKAQKMSDIPPDPIDVQWMEQAIALAERGMYSTMPNPRVGCVLVRDNEVVGSGWHRRAGEDHAEVVALREAGEQAQGATAYVTLEPCHHHGQTPPCVNALIEAAVARVVVAMTDPDPRTAGQSIERLSASGIDVCLGVCEKAAAELNIGFIQRQRTHRPWIRVKMAASLDGRATAPDGQSQWITAETSRADVHVWRARACAVLSGIGTVLADDPLLNARLSTEWPVEQPARVILDSRGRFPPHAKMLQTQERIDVISTQPPPTWVESHSHVSWHCLPADQDGRVSLQAFMKWMAEQCFNEVHVEGGPGLTGAFMASEWLDEVLLYQAPMWLGNGRPMAELDQIQTLDDAVTLTWFETKQMGPDCRMRLRRPGVSK